MAKRIDKVAKAAHIKRNTEGTSNEISFSVLDAAKNSLDGEGNRYLRNNFPFSRFLVRRNAYPRRQKTRGLR